MPVFLDKVKYGIAKGVAQASVKSKELLDVAKLKSQITALEKVRQEALVELGRTVYTLYLNDHIDVDVIKNKGYSIRQIEDQIQNLENDIVRVQTEARQSLHENQTSDKCACGAAVTADMKFCGVCGQKVETDTGKPGNAAPDSFCSECGERLEPDSRFCSACGKKFPDATL